MKLNWFSPLPPARTDIAHYTARVLPALARRSEVTLWTEARDWDRSLADLADVRWYDPSAVNWGDLAVAEVTFYNLGNDARFHGGIWQVSRKHPGVVILHDTRMHQFFESMYHTYLPEGGRERYCTQMERYYGPVGRREGEAWWEQQLTIAYMAERYPLTELAAEGSIAALVHDDEVGDDAIGGVPFAYAPLPYASSQREHDDVATRRLEPPYSLVAFGYIGTNRRLPQFLQALSALPEGGQFHLDIYGEVAEPHYLLAQIEALGLNDNVRVHGFVPERQLDAALDAANLAVNLRFPTAGEASGSQLRIWDHALPALVTRTGWYGRLPEGTVAFVRPDHELEDIQAHLRRFLDDPGDFVKMGERGRDVLITRHSPEAYARTALRLAENAASLRVRAAAVKAAQRAGAEIATWSSPRLPTVVPERISQAMVGLWG